MKAGKHHLSLKAGAAAAATRKVPPRLLAGRERGASSGEFVFAILVLFIAIVVGGLGGVWIARREGLQKPKAAEPPKASEQPTEQPTIQPEEPKAAAKEPAPSPAPTLPAEPKSAAVKLPPKPGAAQTTSLGAVKYSSQGGTTQVTVELGALSLAQAAALPNPDRVYFDLEAGQQTAGSRRRLSKQESVSVSDDPLLAGIRVAHWTTGDIRVVLDLKRPCDFAHRPSPDRASLLIIELKPRP